MTGSPPETWAVALHATPTDEEPVGAGLVVADTLVLACHHVAFPAGTLRELWVAFPRDFHVPPGVRRRVRACRFDGHDEQGLDVVLLDLDEPVPPSVVPARLRRPPGPDLVGLPWRAYGFPRYGDGGRPAAGVIGDEGSYGCVRLTADVREGVAQGFSGAALWSPDYDAVVGIIVKADANTGSGLALTLAYADEHLPGLKLSTLDTWRVGDADEPTHAAWGWTLATDDEAHRHWLPRARGVASSAETGSRFRGRVAALRRLRQFLDRAEPAGRPMIVTGSPGVGKSAVLGRIVTTADPEISAALPPDDVAERATVGSVACAVHVKGKTALEVATEIARGAGVGLPKATVDLMPALRDRLTSRPARFNLVVDALDEAAGPDQTRALIDDVLVPLARTCATLGVQVVVGTRRTDDLGDLLGTFGSDASTIDLDSPEFFSPEDLADYAQATLQLGGPRGPGAYSDPAVAAPVAASIAALADRNFLIAGLVARTRALRDLEPADPRHVSFTPTVGDTLNDYLQYLPDAGTAPARLVLTALAYAETPGLPISLWQGAIQALGVLVTGEQLDDFARSSAANFLVETGDPARPTYRLFHQALNDALLAHRRELGRRETDEQRLVTAWIQHGRSVGWGAAPDYLLRSLSPHAARVGAVDDLLNDDGYLLHAHLDRLLPVADTARTASGRARRLLLQRTPRAVGAEPAERAAMFSVVDRIDGLSAGIDASTGPYQARWAHTPPRLERTVFEGHSLGVYDVCPIAVDGRNLLASAGEDGTVRLWDPLTNQTVRVFSCHDDCIRGVCAVVAGGRTLLATAGHDGTIGIWDPRSGVQLHSFTGHHDWVRNICAVPMGPGGDLLVSAGDDRTVRVWDVTGGTLLHTLTGHSGWVTAVTHVPVGPYGLIASTGYDGYIRLWDPVHGVRRGVLRGHNGWVTTLYALRAGGRVLLASGGYDGTVRLWDPVAGEAVRCLDTGGGPITDLCTVRTRDGDLLASTGEDGTIRLWETETGTERQVLRGQASWIRAVCELPLPGRHMLATAGDDGTVRLWDPAGERPQAFAESVLPGSIGAVCAVAGEAGPLVATGGNDGAVRLWDLTTGAARTELRAGASPVNAICVIEDEEPALLATAGADAMVHLWDSADPSPIREFREHLEPVNAVAVLRTTGGLVVASAGDDETVRLWRPHNAEVIGRLVGHRAWVTSLVVVDRDGTEALASADKSGVVRFWAADGTLLWERLGHQSAVNALSTATVDGRPTLISAGADRTIRLWEPPDGRPIRVLSGHTAEVTGLAPGVVGDRQVLASASLDRTIRLWDPRTGRRLRTIHVHHRARTCRWIGGYLVIGLDQGLLTLTVDRL
ncbi:NACHT and WD repeat domain-containing protein [Paractinoplanes toevensis]|uniref:Uncharacterized protein n=1 Tax=Paractinoplanes toevensis TaxID=571911 RepID=A0A919T7M8_9ACTN|nr:WD40 repeat domain-containing protein [Actinoplanes toevensis]GIM89566.1 hypothetical protein Ato02nite_013590 [Actinoplanes toevensis]